MNVISKANLFEAARATENPDVVERAARWYELATKNDFANFVELRVAFPAVDWPNTAWMAGKAVPRPGQPLYWDAFIQRLCSLYSARFG